MNAQPLSSDPDAREWLRFAAEELKAARKLCGDPNISPNIVGFHAQQAAEKAIKAALLHAGVKFPFTHDLGELLRIYTAAGRAVPFEAERLEELTPYATHQRYPGYVHQPGVKEQQRLLAVAEEVFAWAEALIGSVG